MNRFKRPSIGDPFRPSAEREAYLLEAADKVHGAGRSVSLSAGLGTLPRVEVLVKNTTASDVPWGGVLRIDGMELDLENGHQPLLSPLMTGKAVTSTGDTIAVMTTPVAAGDTGVGVISGLVAARVEGIRTTTAGLSPGVGLDRLAATNGGGYPWLWAEGDSLESDPRWGLVLLGGGGSSACTTSYDLFILGDPSGGDITLPVTYNSVTESIVIPYNSSDTAIKTLIDAHSEFVAATVECTVTSTGPGGVLPGNNMIIGLPSGATMTLSSTNTLVRRPGGFYPSASLRLCGCQ